MDDQSLSPMRKYKYFQHVPKEILHELPGKWLRPIPGVPKVDFQLMQAMLAEGKWDAWWLTDGPSGIAVSYPEDGVLFVYYLRANKLFGMLSKEDLLAVAYGEGLDGLKAQTKVPGVVRLLQAVGFEHDGFDHDAWIMELSDGR